jgi:hypothetical protein
MRKNKQEMAMTEIIEKIIAHPAKYIRTATADEIIRRHHTTNCLLTKMVKSGKIVRFKPGYYSIPNSDGPTNLKPSPIQAATDEELFSELRARGHKHVGAAPDERIFDELRKRGYTGILEKKSVQIINI